MKSKSRQPSNRKETLRKFISGRKTFNPRGFHTIMLQRPQVNLSDTRFHVFNSLNESKVQSPKFKVEPVRPDFGPWTLDLGLFFSTKNPEPEDADAELEDAARSERSYVRERLREELKREPTEQEVDEWLRQHTEGY
jgi:sulfite reductase alpha subunit-like flavoprotein